MTGTAMDGDRESEVVLVGPLKPVIVKGIEAACTRA